MMKAYWLKAVTTAALALGLTTVMTTGLRADMFTGTNGQSFTVDFQQVGNTGNGNDSTGYGAVPYGYRIGTYEISQSMIDVAWSNGVADSKPGYWTDSQPSAGITWYQAALFVNWLNTNAGHQAAYNFSGTNMSLWSASEAWTLGGTNLYRNKDAYYFLPSENEWYKAAYHKNDGNTANYWVYPTASDTAPTAVAGGTNAGTAVYNNVTNKPAETTNAGGLSAYGTMGQGGNVWEWQESAFDGTNNSTSEARAARGGLWDYSEVNLRSSSRNFFDPAYSIGTIGFRVASVPEPTTGLFVLVAGGAILLGARLKRSL